MKLQPLVPTEVHFQRVPLLMFQFDMNANENTDKTRIGEATTGKQAVVSRVVLRALELNQVLKTLLKKSQMMEWSSLFSTLADGFCAYEADCSVIRLSIDVQTTCG